MKLVPSAGRWVGSREGTRNRTAFGVGLREPFAASRRRF
jgi:hypothetical protein